MPLPNRPEAKIARLPEGCIIRKRGLFGVSHLHRKPTLQASQDSVFDSDGYRLPSRAAHTRVIKVTTNAPFMSLVRRVRKALDKESQQTKKLSLAARVAAIEAEKDKTRKKETYGAVENALDDVVLIGTGRAIQKMVEVGAFFTRQTDLTVVSRTRTLSTIDDISFQTEGAEEQEQVRVRNLSCLEIGIRHRTS
ncbi:ribonucleases P/MRP protein subunit POP7 [Diplogelasinospora grovesii]|uniref:Ribonucleases P/MRP protein subunit POP7 n=1 Tax=Diplogelasinospora grovesii TaxID=303347 RepID=A0AAN6S4J4_9PEZI|nr:ribonucleases P/MRP protein subunit POP7 [Diplogelasinospora grovesii]